MDPDADPFRATRSPDGTTIARFRAGSGRPILLVHGTTADHTTFRVLGPRLATFLTTEAVDRRGRGASGDAAAYSIEREFEDVAAVADELAAANGAPIPVLGHSYGGRCALGAALLTDAIDRVICYEGAPAPPGQSYQGPGLVARLREALDKGANAEVLATFMREVVGMTEADVDDFRANPIWPLRVAAAHTIPRELEAETSAAASLDRLGTVRQPVLQLLGSVSRPVFHDATAALDARLADGRVLVVEGAKHAAHHTHPDVVVQAVRDFLA